MSIRLLVLSSAALALAAPTSILAKQHNHGQVHHAPAVHGSHAKPAKAAKAATGGNRHVGHACPPGLAKKNPGCLPPGQWKKGNRVPGTWTGHYVAYAGLPDFYRSRFRPNPGYRYLYQDGRVLVIDAVTRTIVDILIR